VTPISHARVVCHSTHTAKNMHVRTDQFSWTVPVGVSVIAASFSRHHGRSLSVFVNGSTIGLREFRSLPPHADHPPTTVFCSNKNSELADSTGLPSTQELPGEEGVNLRDMQSGIFARVIEGEADAAETSLQLLIADLALKFSPVLIIALGMLLYDAFPAIAEGLRSFAFQNFAFEGGRPVADQVLISVVVPGLGILFATLSSSTLSVLRSRQQSMRRSLRQEVILLNTLAKPLRKLFPIKTKERCQALRLLRQYAVWTTAETLDSDALDKEKIFDIQSRITGSLLDTIGTADNAIIECGDLARAIVLSRVVGYAQGLVNTLDQLRSARRATTLFTFPVLHWLILLSLASSLPVSAMLLAATFRSASLVVYQDAFVRLLVAVITAAPFLLVFLLLDLNEPYAGYICITSEPADFRYIAKVFQKELDESEAEVPARTSQDL